MPGGGWRGSSWNILRRMAFSSFFARLLGRRPAPLPAPEPEPVPEPEPAPEPVPEPPPEPPPPFDALAARRDWLRADEALASLYRSLQVSPSLEEACAGLLDRAKALLSVEIPDPAALAEALERLARQVAESSSDPAWLARGRDPLLLEVLALRSDLGAVAARLARRPADDLLPFLEEIPAKRGGEVVWRLPRELALLRRRPADLAAFLDLCGELGETLLRASLERPADLRPALVETLERVERDAGDPAVYLPFSLRSFEERLHEWLAAPSPELRERRRTLDRFLLELLETRYRLAAPRPLAAAAEAALAARGLAAEALKSGWLLQPCLVLPLLHLLLLAELAPLPPGSSPVAAVLEAVAAEVGCGFFDAGETARRLRSLESHAFFVSSLLFPLLRLAAPTAESVLPQGR